MSSLAEESHLLSALRRMGATTALASINCERFSPLHRSNDSPSNKPSTGLAAVLGSAGTSFSAAATGIRTLKT